MFTQEEIETAKRMRATIIKENVEELKAVYMAGEIVMWDEMQTKLLSQATVSGNEASQSENKKDGEVTVAFAEWKVKNNWSCEYSIMDNKLWWGRTKHERITTQELYEIFKEEQKAKATDR